MTSVRLVFSYVRFSSLAQAEGDSTRRQTDLRADWLRRNPGLTLDTRLAMDDRGISAFRGRNRTAGALAAFLAEVEGGRVPRGSVLLVENLDRLSRENPWDAVPLLCSIVNAGIEVVTLLPSEMRFTRGSDITPLVLAVVEFGRSHGESATKAVRLSETWREKKDTARADLSIQTTRVPAWLEVVGRGTSGKRKTGGTFRPIPERVRVVRRMFDLALSGRGLSLIVRALTDDGVPTWGRGLWSKVYVHKILTGRAVLGEYQPRTAGKPSGDPIPGYYPAVVDESTWERAQAALSARRGTPGRLGHRVASLFTGLLHDAASRGRMLIAGQSPGPHATAEVREQRRRVLVPAVSMDRGHRGVSFPYAVFEEAVLSRLVEIDPAEVINAGGRRSEASGLADELAAVEARLAEVERELTTGNAAVGPLAKVLVGLAERQADLARRLADVRRAESAPVEAAWTGARELLRAAATDEATRLRLRAHLQSLIQEAWCLILPRGGRRICVCQIHFRTRRAATVQRDYVIYYQSAGNGRPGGWAVLSAAAGITSDAGPLDLRDPAHAALLWQSPTRWPWPERLQPVPWA